MGILETIGAIIALIIIIPIGLIPLELISSWEDKVHQKKRGR